MIDASIFPLALKSASIVPDFKKWWKKDQKIQKEIMGQQVSYVLLLRKRLF